ncbi:hypothetical protein IscW_ISCW006607 [Ixodes scapularis]|uniref:RING-type domain-containing protein n=1 Tax=Ixodes scapularis TaxID=6945 RepID=B7PMD3_IXOSC|nr:hypothetical protein IscW_ISCW006607 [Ixodes scapularis]|eukprot:XP_002434931.1 hypothetical protein IscW_ISCW006607 [Ixodes scapularis]
MVTGCLHAFCLDCYKHIQPEAGPKCPVDGAFINPTETKQFVLGDAQRKDLTAARRVGAPSYATRPWSLRKHVTSKKGTGPKCGTWNGNHALEVDALTADAVRCAGDNKVNILVENIRKCSLSVNDLVDLARNLAESVQHCVRATDESTTKTSDLVGTVEKCTEGVNNVRAVHKVLS